MKDILRAARHDLEGSDSPQDVARLIEGQQ
ncbi:hypothetical protein PSPO01_16644 [Paraphaeosphaeria sporulosa]